jgi:hypothetical protein
MKDLDEVQGLAATALLHHDACPGVPPHSADKTGGKRQALHAPVPQMHHAGGESVLQDIGESMPQRRALRLAHLSSGRAGRAANSSTGEARGSRPNRNCGADDGGRCLKGSSREAGDGGCARRGCGVGGGQSNHPCGGRSDGGGGSCPSRLCGSRRYSQNWTKEKPEFLFFPKRDGVQR